MELIKYTELRKQPNVPVQGTVIRQDTTAKH